MGRLPRMSDGGLTALACILSLAVYLRTLYPGLNGIGDTPKFQFVGAILGTPHPPGYPVYTLLSWLFSKLPFGNPAWRINLLSAVAAALAVALLFLLLRRLEAGRAPALAAALSFGFGPILWSQATLAEVYTLAAALLAALLLAVASWGRTRAPGRLDIAVYLAALGMAHHTSVAMVVPALVVYVLATDGRAALAPRLLGRGALLVLLGLSPYLLVLIRNLQGAPYLGARARTLGELWAVMRGASFESHVFAFDLTTLLTDRVALVTPLLRRELSLLGLLLVLVGLAWLGRRARREALLLGLCAAGLLVFVLGYDVPDLDVFLVPALVPMWVLAGVGLDCLARGAARVAPASLVAAGLLVLPAAQAARHFRASDHSDRSFEMRYFAALFETLPARAAIAAESYTVDHMVLYEIFAEDAARGRDIVTVPGDAGSIDSGMRRGYTAFVFGRTADALRPLGYRLAPVAQPGPVLTELLGTLPAERLVMQAGRRGDERVAALGTPAAPELLIARGDGAAVEAARGEAIGPVEAPLALRAEVRDGGFLFADGMRVLRSEAGLAVAVLGPGGRLVDAYDLDETLRVPFDARAFPLFRVVSPPECADVGSGAWADTSRLASAGRILLRVDNHAPFEASLVLWLFGERPLRPRVEGSLGHGTPAVEVRAFSPVEARAALLADGLSVELSAAHAVRVTLRVDDGGHFSATSVDLGGFATSAWARGRADLENPRRVQVCSLVPGDADVAARETRVSFGPEASPFLGAGWHDPEPAGFRWSSAAEADVRWPIDEPARRRLRVRAMPLAGAGVAPGSLSVRLNGMSLGFQKLLPGFASYDFAVPADAQGAGTNRISFVVDHARSPRALGLSADDRQLGVAVSDLALRRE